jgi:putative transport protein
VSWLFQLQSTQPVAQAIGILTLVCAGGMALGSLRIRGIGLGTTSVLFVGLFTGYFSKPVDHATLNFVKEFGLLLFVFTIGLQLGPGFFSALKQDGVRLNALAAAVVLCGAAVAATVGWLLNIDFAAVVGLLSGATTSTPSLGAAEQTIATLPVSQDRVALPALAYAVAYPAAIAGIMGTLLTLKTMFRVDTVKEAETFLTERSGRAEPLESWTLVVGNANLDGVPLEAIPSRAETGVIVSRHRGVSETEVHAAVGGTRLRLGDSIVAVGTPAMLRQFERVVGRRSDEDLRLAPGNVTDRGIVVTRQEALGKTIGELALDARCGAVAGRLTRADVALSATPGMRLQFGDVLQMVGDEKSLERAEKLLGNSIKDLNQTHFIPLFAGIALGIILGTMPIVVPGFPQPLRLGLAGGPLIVALVLGRIGHIGRVVFHMPLNANLAFREFGIALFFAAVGLAAGPQFFVNVLSSAGIRWLGAGLCVTILPLLVVGVFARAVLDFNYTVLGGLLAGSVTDPPALAFVNALTKSDAATLPYVTVYPVTTLLRILTTQMCALFLVH